MQEEVNDEESAIKNQMRDLLEDRAQIDQQLVEMQLALDAIEKGRKRKAELERLERERLEKERLLEARRLEKERKRLAQQAKRVERGDKIEMWIENPDEVIGSFFNEVTALSCANGGTIMLYESGEWSWTDGIPTLLHNKLHGRQRTLPKPTYVAIGSQDRYYVQFADGKAEWVCCDEMHKALQKSNNESIASVAFGADYNSYAIVYKGGSYQYSGIPDGLHDLIVRRRNKRDLKCISLGPNNEYFVSAKNGRTWWGGMSSQSLSEVSKYKDRIRYLDFSSNDQYLLRYS
mmetsp:Transcript_11300/g.27201  ORF Transcript_11300/g.27201 Transcript_11300/m.27201 type:complete len:290 (+) Transcript_11300:405-1274(+)